MRLSPVVLLLSLCATTSAATAATTIRIMPPDGGVLAAGQRVDIRVEATGDAATGTRPSTLRVWLNGDDVTARNAADADVGAPAHTRNFLWRDVSQATPGPFVIRAEADGVVAEAQLRVEGWQAQRPLGQPRARNVILLLGDGMGAAHRTAARLVSRGVHNGKAAGRLAMDTLPVTGMVMTGALNAVITDSSPGMSSYVTGQKHNNNQEGVFPDNTPDAFDNPRIEYLGELLRRTRGPGFNVGIVTTADVTDSTPAANAVHTSSRFAGAGIASRFFDERATNGVTVLLGGGANHFLPKAAGGTRPDDRNLMEDYRADGYVVLRTGGDVRQQRAAAPPARMIGLLHPTHLPVAFDKVGAGRYSRELALERNTPFRDTPMLDELAQLALASLDAHSPDGFYLLVEGASIDKRAHAADAERTIWDTIEFDRAVAVALAFAARTNRDQDPDNDTLVIVTADHESGGMAVVGVGNERYAPSRLGRAVRDYAAVFRFVPEQELTLTPNYERDDQGYPIDPDPSRKLLLGWAAAPDYYEDWQSEPTQSEAAILTHRLEGPANIAVANPVRNEPGTVPGFLVAGVIENGATPCPVVDDGCPADTASAGHTFAGHTATDVPLSAFGPGAWQFTGVYENTDVLLKVLRATEGTYEGGK